jgi:hypothetical protein
MAADATYLAPIEGLYFQPEKKIASISGSLGPMLPGEKVLLPFRRAQAGIGGDVIFILSCQTEAGTTREGFVTLQLDGRRVPATSADQLMEAVNANLEEFRAEVASALHGLKATQEPDLVSGEASRLALPSSQVAVTALNAQILEQAVRSREILAVTANRQVRAVLIPITAPELTQDRLSQSMSEVIESIRTGLQRRETTTESLVELLNRRGGHENDSV